MTVKDKKSTFFFRNLLRGLIWLVVIIVVFWFLKNKVDVNYLAWLEPVYTNSAIVILIYTISEILIGIIPPEVFMIWALQNGSVVTYAMLILMLAVLSYLAGLIGYFFGRYLNTTLLYRFIRRKFLKKMERMLNLYGLYIIIVAALTPLPFSGVSMLVGSVKYPLKKYILYSLFRFARFAIYSWFIWEANAF
ncbi:MAG: VTT domain-containing protein [Bacteroidales bacterium]|nr:MAG: VTT domain-containing protein [Bacteroidales bacterium]